MSTEFSDETFEEQQAREKLDYFLGQYSAEIRKNLLSKNVKKPENLYDILYTKTRKEMLAKNESTFSANIDDNSTSIRNTMLSKHVEKQVDLDSSGENYRQSQISKNNLLKSSVDLNELSNSVRDGLLSKNVLNEVDLDSNAKIARELNVSNNTNKENNLDKNASGIRENLLASNVSANIDLDLKAESLREDMLSSNIKSGTNLEKDALKIRVASLSKNSDKNIDIDKNSAEIREVQESKNLEKNTNIDLSAEAIRSVMLSSNKDNKQSLDSISESARKTNEIANVEKNIDIENIADITRLKMISVNVDVPNQINDIAEVTRNQQKAKNDTNIINLDKKSSEVRNNMLSSNEGKELKVDDIAEQSRGNMLSSNKENGVDLDATSESVRKNLLSNNQENNTDLDANSTIPRNSLLASNVAINTDLDANSTVPRNTLLASNVANNTDLDTNSTAPRNALLASNVANNIDLDTNSTAPRNTLLASNVANNIDLDANSTTPRNTLLASNVDNNIDLDANSTAPRNTLLASNVDNNIDLDVLSSVPRGTLLASNVPINIDLDADAIILRNALLASNVPNINDLDQNSSITRSDLLSSNVQQNLNIDTNSSVVRDTLLSSNIDRPNNMESIANVFRHDLLSKNSSSKGFGTTMFLGGTSTFIGVSNLEIMSAPIRELMKLRGTIFDKNTDLQPIYGLATESGIPTASITNAAQLYNLQKNAFMNTRYNDRNSGYNLLSKHNAQGFQELLSFSQISNTRIKETNTTPESVIADNHGVYVGRPSNEDNSSSVTKILKPTGGALGTAASMMSNTVTSDAIAFDFNKHERGVVRILNTIRKDKSIAMARNYDSQNNTSFIVGINSDGTDRLAFSRYTISNPYQPNVDAGTLELKIKNYAIANGNPTLVHTMSFPPYVKSFANSDSANWNKVDFLGRPEAIYTYSNSSREGSLSFYVLTDYSQSVDVGVNWTGDKKTTTETFEKHFTEQVNGASKNNEITSEIKNKEKQKSEYQALLTTAQENNVGGTASIQTKITVLNLEISDLQSKQKELTNNNSTNNYSEFDVKNGNVYKSLISNGTPVINGSIDIQTEQTKERLGRMKKELLFQPAFFSGDKVDFLRRMEFLAKLTRPARNTSGKGFSFTSPPVCHLHLGDFFNHDVIINNISYDYTDSPWTIDGSGGRVQPMFCLVNISFNIIGTYSGKAGEDAPLADDIGGFYQPRIK